MDNQQPKDPLGILKQKPAKVSDSDPLGILKKNKSLVSEDGGKVGISAPPSDSGKGFGELKPAEKQPTQIFKEQGVGEDTMLARRLAREQRAAAGGTAGSLTLFGYHFGPRERLRQNLRVAKEDIGELEGLSNAIDRGVLQGKLADMLALGQMPKREDIKEIARINKELTQIPSTGAYQRFNAAPDLKTAAKEFVDNPFEITSQLISESLSALVRHGYSRALAGAGTGAALGSLIPIPGISTAAGAGTGYIAGMGVAGYNLEMASSIMDSFREAGVDVTDEKSLTKAFDDSNTLKKAREFANKRAVPIAIFDMFSAGMGGKLLGKPAKTILGKVGRGAAEVGIQMGMAGAGETAAQLTAGQKINPTAILAEVIGEAGGGAPDIIVGTMIENKKNNQSIRKEAVRLDIEPQQLQDMLDISEASGEITDAQANEIKKEYEDIQKVKQAVPEEFKKNADVIEALEQKRQLEAKKQGLDPVFAKKIDDQIKALDTKIDDIVAAGEVAPEMAQYTMEAPRLPGEPEQISKPIELSVEPQVPAAPAKAPITTIEVEEVARQMQPITDRMVQIEREFENLGYKIDTDYDNEMIVSDIEGNEVGEIPESLVPLAAEYEKATRRLGEFDDRARERALSKSREVVEAEAVEVKPELPAAPAKSRVKDAIDKYDEGDISTINDLVDEIEAIADEEGNQVVLDAVEEYREEQRYNESLKGRGDMDAAEDAFLSKIRGVGEVAPEAKPELPAAPVIETKKEEYAIPEPSPEGVLQPTQEGVREEGGERRGVESPVERVAAAQESKAEAAKKEIAKREKAYAKPEGKQLAVNELVNELYKFNNQFKGRLGLKTPESDRKRNELLIEAKRLGFQTSVDRYGRISVKGARAIDKSNSNMSIDSKFVPLEKRSEKLRDFYNKIQGLSQRYGWDFQSFMPNVIIGADGKKMNNRQIANALKDLENGIPSKGANLVLNDLEAMAEKGFIEVRDGQNVRGVPIDEFFNELTRIAEGDIDRVLGEEVESLPEADLVKWFEEMEAEQQFESEIYEEPITPETLPEGGVEPSPKKEVPIVIRAAAGEPTGEAGRGAPPTEGGEKPAPAEEGEPRRLSGIKKGLVSKEALANVDLDKTGDKQLLMAGRQIIESGEVEPKLLIDKIIDEGRGVLSPAEVVAMITYKADLDTQIEDLTAEIEQLEASGQDIGQRGVKLSNLQDDRQNFDIAAVITAQQQSMAFRLRMWMMDRYYNLQREISEYKKANNGVISEEVRKRFEQYDAEIQKLKKKINELGVEKLDEEGQAAVDNIAEDVEREDAKTLTDEEVDKRIQKGVEAEINKIYEQLPAKKRSRADQAIAALERIQKRLRSRTYDASIGIPVAIIDMGITTIKKAIKAGVAIEKAIELGIDKIKEGLKGKPFTNEDKFRKDLLEGFELEGIKTEKEVAETPSVNNDGTINIPEKFLRDLVRKGINTIDGLVDAAFKELEPQLPELTKRQVRDAITQYGKKVNPTKDEVRQQLGAAKRLGRLISELEDLQKMNAAEFALKYLKKKPSKITEAEKIIKQKIKVLAKELETDAQRLEKAKDAAKRRIDELQRRLNQGDFSKKPKKVLKSDAELETLIAKKLDLEYEFKKEIEKARLRNRSIGEKVFDAIEELTQGVTRSLVAGFDLSATLVQLGRVTFTKPSIAAKAFAEGLRQFVSPKRNENFLKKYRSSYYGVVAKNSGLAISEVNEKISAKEQIFLLNWANAIYDTFATIVTLGHKPSAEFIKLINPLKASQRAFEGAVNYARVNSFNNQIKYLLRKGYRPESDPEIFKSSADFVNTTTGRGSLGKLEGASRWLGNVFFSARKLASEFKLYSPYAFYYYGKMPAPIRKRALANFAIFSANVLVSHVLLRAALEASGEEQDEDFWDPDSPNFLSFKINGKVVSVLGGIKSMIVFMSRLLIGSRYVDQYGVESVFGERVGKKINTKKDLVTQFVYGKFSPGLGALRDYYDQNPNYEDDDEILQNLVVPMWLQDASEIYKDDPASVTAMFNLLSSIGASVRKVDVANVRDKIIFKEKVKGKEVKRVVELTDAQKEEFQNIVNTNFKVEMAKISKEIKSAKTFYKRAEYIKMAADKAKKDGQEILEKKYKKLFQQFPVQEKEEDDLIQKVKKKLK